MQFSQRLKELRVEKGVSQSELAEKIYVSRSAVAKWENGLGLPCAQSLELIAEYFGVSYDSLLSDCPSEAIIVNKNVTISRSKKIIIAIGAVCLAALAAIIFMLVYFTRSPKPAGGEDPDDRLAGDSIAKVVGVYGDVRDENDRNASLVNKDIVYSYTYYYHTYNAYKLEINKEYSFHVNPILTGGSTPVCFIASGVTLEYDKDLFDISLEHPEYGDDQFPEYILKVKAECELAAIAISVKGKDYYGNSLNTVVLISAE